MIIIKVFIVIKLNKNYFILYFLYIIFILSISFFGYLLNFFFIYKILLNKKYYM